MHRQGRQPDRAGGLTHCLRRAGAAPVPPAARSAMSGKHRFGLGLRRPHYRDFIDGDAPVAVDFVEVVSENFMVDGGRWLKRGWA